MEGRGSYLHQAPSLLLKYINCILILHFQLQIDKKKKERQTINDKNTLSMVTSRTGHISDCT